MQSNKKLWIVVLVVVITTIITSITTFRSQGQQASQSEQTQDKMAQYKQARAEFESQFPIVDYNALVSNKAEESDKTKAEELEKRKAKSSRYDNFQFVSDNPNPKTIESSLTDDSQLSPIPVKESEIIIIGEILNAQANLSNNKFSVYSEFTVRIEKALKNRTSKEVITENITIDRLGGFVRYPNGQKVLYSVSGNGMPRVGKRYVLFLTKPDKSPNYNILTGYELKEDKVYPLDTTYIFKPYKEKSKIDLIKAIEEKIISIDKENHE
jgi:hypothetical protein